MFWVDRRVERDLRKAPRHVVERFFEGLAELGRDPLRARPRLDIRRLEGREGEFGWRLGEWRILYHVDFPNRVVRVTTADPRRRAYR